MIRNGYHPATLIICSIMLMLEIHMNIVNSEQFKKRGVKLKKD